MQYLFQPVAIGSRQDTYLILYLAPVKDLPKNYKVFVKGGTNYQALLLKEMEGHYWLQFPTTFNNQYRWFADINHWSIEQSEHGT